MQRFAVVVVLVLAAGSAAAQQKLFPPLQPNESVVTCFSNNDGGHPVFAIVDTRDPANNGAVVHQNWFTDIEHSLPSWTLGNLGTEVFGVALDDAPMPNIYLTSTGVYTSTFMVLTQNAPANGQVFKVRGSDWVAAPLGPPLPQETPAGGQGLGNIAYDAAHQQLFVTNFYDGKIYRLDPTTGQQKSSFDPFVKFVPGQKGLAPRGERLWGIGVYNDRVYFGVWSRDQQPGTADNTIWSVALDSVGEFTGNEQHEITLSAGTVGPMPVSDISFSSNGRMLVSQRGMTSANPNRPLDTVPHAARVLEYVRSGSTWQLQPVNKFRIGYYSAKTNASGGATYACPLIDGQPASVIITGDALKSGTKLYGLQITPATGGDETQSYLIDVDEDLTTYDKTQIGDVAVYNTCENSCAEVTTAEVLCATDGSGDYIVKLKVKNLSTQTIQHLYLTQLPSPVSATPNHIDLSQTPVPPGGTITTPPIRIHNAAPGSLSFVLGLINGRFEECCALLVTIDLPPCDCAQIVKPEGPICPMFPGTGYTFFFTLQNLFPAPITGYLVTPETPSGAVFTPNVVDLTSTPIGQNQQLFQLFSIRNVHGGERVCFRITLFTENFKECCTFRYCVTIPRCYTDVGPPVPLSGTQVFFEAGRLVLDNPQGDPAVRFPLPAGTEGVDLEWVPIAETLPPGAYLEQRLRGSVDGGADEIIASTRTIRAGNGSELRTAFPALDVTRYRYEFYRAGKLVGFQLNVAPDVPAIIDARDRIPTRDAHFVVSGFVPASVGEPASCSEPGPGCMFAGYTFQEANIFTLAATMYRADEVRVYPEDGTGTRIAPSALELEAHGTHRLVVTGLRLRFDCNDNGVDDGADIANGTSRDLDRDGISDECQPPRATAAVSLGTGYDQRTDALLPAGVLPDGTDDDDWTIVAPGPARPAKVVITPPYPSWQTPFARSQWISADPSAESRPDATRYVYERCFCLAADAGDITLDLQLRADNEATVSLNGRTLAGPGGTFSGAPLTIHRTGTIGDGFFTAGLNCLRVDVTDNGVFTGLDAGGGITVTGAVCNEVATPESDR